MIYHEFKGLKISALGIGCNGFPPADLPVTGENRSKSAAKDLPAAGENRGKPESKDLPEAGESSREPEAMDLPEAGESSRKPEATDLPEAGESSREPEAMNLPEAGESSRKPEAIDLPVEDNKFELWQEMIHQAINSGVNYFECSESYGLEPADSVQGNVLKQYPRESFFVASGFCGFRPEEFDKADVVFQSKLNALQTDHIDFYILQNITEFNIDKYLDPSIDLVGKMLQYKSEGKIRYLGCSFIGNIDPMRRFLECYGQAMDFCKFPLNWMDWDLHYAKQKVNLCKKMQLPVWAEDPFKLSLSGKLPEGMTETKAFQFIQSIPEVKVAVLNLDNMEQLLTAVSAFDTFNPLSQDEVREVSLLARSMYTRKMRSCTGCRRCMKHCIKFLDIAGFMDIYNEEIISGPQRNTPMYIKSYPVEKQPQSCCHWGPCQSVCPQKLDIIRMMLALATQVRRSPYDVM